MKTKQGKKHQNKSVYSESKNKKCNRFWVSAHYHYFILMVCCLMAGFIHGIEGGTSGLFYMPISQHLNIPISTVSFYVTIKGVVMVLCIPLAYKLMKRIQLNFLLSIATLIYIVGLLMISKSQGIHEIYFAACLMGLGASFLSTLVIPYLIGNWFKKRQGLMLGIAFGFSGFTGSVVGPIVSEFIQMNGWRSGYQLIAFLIGILLLPLLVFVKATPKEMKLLPYGQNTDINSEIDAVQTKVNKQVLKQYVCSSAFILSVLFGIMLALTNGILFHLTTYAQTIGFTSTQGSFITSMTLLGATINKVMFGNLNDRWKITSVVFLASILGAVGLVILFTLTQTYVLMLIGAFLYGSVVALTTLEPPILIRQLFGDSYYDDIFVFVNMATLFCYSASTTLYAFLFDLTKTYSTSFILCILFTLMTYFFCKLSVKHSRKLVVD